jgi:hypothetical protein
MAYCSYNAPIMDSMQALRSDVCGFGKLRWWNGSPFSWAPLVENCGRVISKNASKRRRCCSAATTRVIHGNTPRVGRWNLWGPTRSCLRSLLKSTRGPHRRTQRLSAANERPRLPTPLTYKKSLDTAQFCVSATHGCDGPITSASASEHLSSLLHRRRLHKRPRRHPFGQSVDATNGKAKAKIPAVLRTLKPPSSTHIRHMLTVWLTIRFAPISCPLT